MRHILLHIRRTRSDQFLIRDAHHLQLWLQLRLKYDLSSPLPPDRVDKDSCVSFYSISFSHVDGRHKLLKLFELFLGSETELVLSDEVVFAFDEYQCEGVF